MTKEQIEKILPGDVIMNIKTREAQVVKSVEGTAEKGCVFWEGGGSTPMNPHLQSINYVSLMRDRTVYVPGTVYDAIKCENCETVQQIQNTLLRFNSKAKVIITKDYWIIEE